MKRPAPGLVRTVLLTAAISIALTLAGVAFWLRPLWLPVGSLDLRSVADGSYIGSCQNKLLTAVVEADVENHVLTDIRVLYHKPSYMGPARAAAQQIVDAQSLEVDGISGATLTVRTVQKAVENALTPAHP